MENQLEKKMEGEIQSVILYLMIYRGWFSPNERSPSWGSHHVDQNTLGPSLQQDLHRARFSAWLLRAVEQ